MAFGRITAHTESSIMVPFSMKITEVHVEPGQIVPAGKSLLHFHSPALLKDFSNYANSRKLFMLAEKQQKVVREGAKEHILTRQKVVSSEQTLVQYATEQERSWDRVHTDLMLLNNDMGRKALNALLDKNDTSVVADIFSVLQAPFTGIVINRPPQVGLWVKADTPLFEFEDLHRVYVTVTVPENMVNNWLSGETLIEKKNKTLKLHRLPGAPGIDIQSGMRLLLFTLENQGALFRDGEWTRVRHRGLKESVVWIPESAVVSRNNKTWCMVLRGQGYTPLQIEVGPAVSGKIPVRSGLTAGQQVVRENAYELLYRDLKELIQFVD